jgi:hypothetical protein
MWQLIRGEPGQDVAEILAQAEALFLNAFCLWAADVVRAFPELLGNDPGTPPDLITDDPAQAIWPTDPTEAVTGTPNTIMAGRRLIFWAAAAFDPRLRTQPSYRHLVLLPWFRCWALFQDEWRTWHQPFDWVQQAFDRLIATRTPPTVPPVTAQRSGQGADVAHSPDFRSVRWFGATYSFTANQAPVVKLLFDNWQAGTPDCGDETLLNTVDAASPPARLNVLFRDHPAWGTMIVEGGSKGTHRLTEVCPAKRRNRKQGPKSTPGKSRERKK